MANHALDPNRSDQPRGWQRRRIRIPFGILVVTGFWLGMLGGVAVNVATTRLEDHPTLPQPLGWVGQHPWPAVISITAVASLVGWWQWRRDQATTGGPGTMTLHQHGGSGSVYQAGTMTFYQTAVEAITSLPGEESTGADDTGKSTEDGPAPDRESDERTVAELPVRALHQQRRDANHLGQVDGVRDAAGDDLEASDRQAKSSGNASSLEVRGARRALQPQEVMQLRDLLLACPVVKDPGSRRGNLIPQLEGELGSPLNLAYDQRGDLEVVNLLRACQQFGLERGLQALVSAVRALDGAIESVADLREYVTQLLDARVGQAGQEPRGVIDPPSPTSDSSNGLP